MEEYFKGTSSSNEIENYFLGEIESVITCLNCTKTFPKTDKMLEIYLNFSESSFNKQTNSFGLCAMIKDSFKEEMLDENSYFCELCKKYTPAKKQNKVKSLPPYLILTVGRF